MHRVGWRTVECRVGVSKISKSVSNFLSSKQQVGFPAKIFVRISHTFSWNFVNFSQYFFHAKMGTFYDNIFAKKKYFANTLSVVAATINCAKKRVEFSAFRSQHFEFYYIFILIYAWWWEFADSSSCPSTYVYPNPVSHEPAK